MNAQPGDLILILRRRRRDEDTQATVRASSRNGTPARPARPKINCACLWVVDFPMFEWSDEEQRLMAMHHLHPSQGRGHTPARHRPGGRARRCLRHGCQRRGSGRRLNPYPRQRASGQNVRDTRIHPEKAQEQFGFLMNAFKFGAPPHGGLAYGLDRWVSLFAGLGVDTRLHRLPKNNSGRDVMLDAPSRPRPEAARRAQPRHRHPRQGITSATYDYQLNNQGPSRRWPGLHRRVTTTQASSSATPPKNVPAYCFASTSPRACRRGRSPRMQPDCVTPPAPVPRTQTDYRRHPAAAGRYPRH